jgi:hypothetical protein
VLKFPGVALWELRMPRTGWTPSLLPYGADQTVYLVIDRFAGPSTVYRETEVERADLETIITDLMADQFNDPIRIIAFNTLEHWSEDVSEYIAFEIQTPAILAARTFLKRSETLSTAM